MNNIKWYFPENLTEAAELAKTGEVILHGGGTSLSGRKFRSPKRIALLDALPLSYVTTENGIVKIGSLTDYHTAADKIAETIPGHVLSQALSGAATTPIRNRITIGGSLALGPTWSDLIGPLVALDAQVKLEGAHSGNFPVTEYLTNQDLRKATLITEVSFKATFGNAWYYRETTTRSDHPVFTITLLVQQEATVLQDIAIVITGHSRKFWRATSIEQQLRGRDVRQQHLHGIAGNPGLRFPGYKESTYNYLNHLVATQLERGLQEILNTGKE